MDASAEASGLIAKIRDLRGTLERLAGPLRTEDADKSFDRLSADHWRRNTYGNPSLHPKRYGELAHRAINR